MISAIFCFCSAVIILLVNLELSRIYRWFYTSIVFAKTFFSFELIFDRTYLLYDVITVDQVFMFKNDLEHNFTLSKFLIADMT